MIDMMEGRHFSGLGGGKDEYNVFGWFLEGLEKRVERACRQHVDLVDDIDLVATGSWGELRLLTQLGRRLGPRGIAVLEIDPQLADQVSDATRRLLPDADFERFDQLEGPGKISFAWKLPARNGMNPVPKISDLGVYPFAEQISVPHIGSFKGFNVQLRRPTGRLRIHASDQ